MEKNVLVTLFKVESEGYQALTELKKEPGTDSYLVSAAALVKKENDKCEMLDGFDTGAKTANDTLKGGLLGMTVGILGGPLGMLLGASYGTMVGMAVDSIDAGQGLSMLEKVAGKLDNGMLALIALTEEETPDALDSKLSAFDTVIARFNADAVAEEVAKANEMQMEMARQARLQLRKEQREKEAEAHEETIANFKARHQD